MLLNLCKATYVSLATFYNILPTLKLLCFHFLTHNMSLSKVASLQKSVFCSIQHPEHVEGDECEKRSICFFNQLYLGPFCFQPAMLYYDHPAVLYLYEASGNLNPCSINHQSNKEMLTFICYCKHPYSQGKCYRKRQKSPQNQRQKQS